MRRGQRISKRLFWCWIRRRPGRVSSWVSSYKSLKQTLITETSVGAKFGPFITQSLEHPLTSSPRSLVLIQRSPIFDRRNCTFALGIGLWAKNLSCANLRKWLGQKWSFRPGCYGWNLDWVGLYLNSNRSICFCKWNFWIKDSSVKPSIRRRCEPDCHRKSNCRWKLLPSRTESIINRCTIPP